MLHVPEDLRQRLKQCGQEHTLAWWDQLTGLQRQDLVAQLRSLDLEVLRRLYAEKDNSHALPADERIAPIPVLRLQEDTHAVRRRGEASLRRGEVAVLLV